MRPAERLPLDDSSPSVVRAERERTTYESCLACCGTLSGCLKIWCPCICCCCTSPVFQLETSEVGILQQFGRFKAMLKPGMHLINPVVEEVITVNLKTTVLTLQPQQVITKDNVTVQISTVVYYRVINGQLLIYKLGNRFSEVSNFIRENAFAVLRNVIGEHTFQELVESRGKLADSIEAYVAKSVSPWGLFVENIFIKDIDLNEQTRRNLQSAAIQKRVSQANIISAQADVETAQLMKASSQFLSSKSAMQIRYLEAIQSIIDTNGPKTLFVGLKSKYDR